MSVNGMGMGRCSAVLHLTVQYPKIAACLCLLGIGGWTALDAKKVEAYCQDPTAANYQEVREGIRPEADKVCFCLDGECGPLN